MDIKLHTYSLQNNREKQLGMPLTPGSTKWIMGCLPGLHKPHKSMSPSLYSQSNNHPHRTSVPMDPNRLVPAQRLRTLHTGHRTRPCRGRWACIYICQRTFRLHCWIQNISFPLEQQHCCHRHICSIQISCTSLGTLS